MAKWHVIARSQRVVVLPADTQVASKFLQKFLPKSKKVPVNITAVPVHVDLDLPVGIDGTNASV